MKFRVASHILCLPCVAVALSTGIVYAWTLASEHAEIGPAPAIFIVLPFLAYYFVPTAWGISYLVLCQFVLAIAWRSSPPRARRWLVAYGFVLLCYDAYLIWWFATGQHARPIGGYL